MATKRTAKKTAAKKAATKKDEITLRRRLLSVVHKWVTEQARKLREAGGPADGEEQYIRFVGTLDPEVELTTIEISKDRTEKVRVKDILAVWAWLQKAADGKVEDYMKFVETLPPETVLEKGLSR